MMNFLNFISVFLDNTDSGKPVLSEQSVKYIATGIAMLVIIGTSIGQGYALGQGCMAISRNPYASKTIIVVLFVGLGVIESSAAYTIFYLLTVLWGGGG